MIFQLELLKKYVDIPDIYDYNIKFEHKNCKLPTAYVYPKSRTIVIVGNKPSLIRYALADLLCHEIAESEFYHEDPQYEGDSHIHPSFQLLESKLKGSILDAMESEHD